MNTLAKKVVLEKVLSVIGEEWVGYSWIYNRLDKTINIGNISMVIWSNVDKIKEIIEWQPQRYGDKEWEFRMMFRKTNKN